MNILNNEWFKITQKDAIEALREIPDESIDLIYKDISYESIEKHRKIGTTTRLKKYWFQETFPNSRLPELFKEIFRVLKNNRHHYFQCDVPTMWIAKPIGESVGFKFWKDIIWNKKAIGMGYHYRCLNERILFFEKGKRKLNDLSIPDILEVKKVFNGYPTEKPEELLKILIRQSTQPGEIVCDSFCGAGATGAAAVRLRRRFIGNDISAEAVQITTDRINTLFDDDQEE